MEQIIQEALKEGKKHSHLGETACYIPELKKVNPREMGIYVLNLDGVGYGAGNDKQKFTIQSISKVLVLTLALMDNGSDKVFEKIGVEATGDPFNSIVRLELKHLNKPLNPLINAGAIATTAMIHGKNTEEKIQRILQFSRRIAGNPHLAINEKVYESEAKTGDRNRSLAYFMKSTGLIQGNVEAIVDMYFKQCSMEVTCQDLAKIGAVYANKGKCPYTQTQIIPKDICRKVLAIMTTCGLYDASGEFAVHVGIPSKSGVGGGILSVVPGRMGIGVYGPALDSKGNSIGGVAMLKYLSQRWDLSIF